MIKNNQFYRRTFDWLFMKVLFIIDLLMINKFKCILLFLLTDQMVALVNYCCKSQVAKAVEANKAYQEADQDRRALSRTQNQNRLVDHDQNLEATGKSKSCEIKYIFQSIKILDFTNIFICIIQSRFNKQ